MKTPPRLLLALSVAFATSPALAHGGQYRGPSNAAPPSNSSGGGTSKGGPSDVVPKSTGSGTSQTGSSSGSSGGAAAGSASSPRGASGSGGIPRGVQIEDDLGRWEFWWEYGKDPYLRLRDAIYATSRTPEDDLLNRRLGPVERAAVERPTKNDLSRVADALVDNLRQASNRDMVSGCVVALAKIGADAPGWKLSEVLLPHLRGGDQELRETAALAFGIAGQENDTALSVLENLIRDSAEGRHLSGDVPVNERTRAFAAYGSGLLLARSTTQAAVERLCAPLLAILESPEAHGRELIVAAIEALAQFPRALPGSAGKLMRSKVVTTLGSYYTKDVGAGDRLLQAHVPVAIARILPAEDSGAAYWKQAFASDLQSGIDSAATSQAGRGGNQFIAQSCALALGTLSGPWNADADGDGPIGSLLVDAYRNHRDQQTRSFALLSIARMGGERARQVLLRQLEVGGKAIEQPWCAMALGVWNARQLEVSKSEGRSPSNDPLISAALTKTFAEARNPSTMAALAIALGLSGDDDAKDRLRAALGEHQKKDDVAGYVALALGLLRDARSIPDVRTLLQSAGRRPFVLMQCSRALGLMGDQSVAAILCKELESPDSSLVRLSAASAALGQIGDRRSIDPLLRMLGNDSLTPLTRAFAAVALGSLCDKDPLPWNSAYATCTNYRAATETLTDGQQGILDIL